MFRRADDQLSGPLPRPAALPPLPYRATRRRVAALAARVPAPHLWALLAITAFGGVLRFYRLTEPVLWNDETLVFWRVCGTYAQLLGPLRTDGFPPLHYSFYWWLGHPIPVGADAVRPAVGLLVNLAAVGVVGLAAAFAVNRVATTWARWTAPAAAMAVAAVVLAAVAVVAGPGWMVPVRWVPGERELKLTPWVIRSVPAICGTATVPAMYFLARQLLPRGASLVAALVTACSAFMLFYSRDAKMYPDAWLLITLNVACLLVWFRTGRSTAYLAWIACGCGAVGLHPSAYAVPALSLVFLLTQRHLRLGRAVLFLVGLGVIYAGVAVYFTKFNLWNERVETIGWEASGLTWVGGFFNGHRTGPEHLAYAGTAFLGGYEWPRDEYLPQIAEPLRDVPQMFCLVIVGLLAVAALPWPLVRGIWRPQRQAARDAAAPEPAWRVWLWLGAWIALPTYGLYCHSVDGFVSPRRWTWELADNVHPAVWAVLIGGTFTLLVAATQWRPLRARVVRLAAFWLATAALFGACYAMFDLWAAPAARAALFMDRPWQSLWEPRYLGFMWPAAGVGVAALLMRLPTRAVRIAAVVGFCGANLCLAGMRLVLSTEPPIDRLAADVWAAQPERDPRGTTRTYDGIATGGIAVAQTNLGVGSVKITGGRYYLQMLADRRPMGPAAFEQMLSPNAPRPFVLRELSPSPEVSVGVVRHDVRTTPTLDRVILWSQLFPGQPLAFDPYRSALPPPWRLAREETFPVRVIWDWRQYWTWVRREYVRAGPAAARR